MALRLGGDGGIDGLHLQFQSPDGAQRSTLRDGILETETTPPETPPTLEEKLARIGVTVDELRAAILGGGQ